MATNSSSSSSSLPTLPNPSATFTVKLTSNNYLLWKLQFEPFLAGYDLLGHIDGSDEKPPILTEAGARNPQYTDWYRRDQIILGWIISSVSEGALQTLVGISSAAAAWTALAAAYGQGSHSQAQSYKSQLCDIKQLTDSAAVYLQRAKSLADRLAALNEPVSEADLIHYILRGLATPYKAFTRSVRHRAIPPSYTELHGLILTEELELAAEQSAMTAGPAFSNYAGRGTAGRGRWDRRSPSRSSSLQSSPVAAPSRRQRQPYAGTSAPSGPSAYFPGPFPGPPASFPGPAFYGPAAVTYGRGLLPTPPPGRQAQSASPKELFCFNCQGKGHHYRQCPSPRHQAHFQPTTHFNYSPEPHPVDSWTLDSGANHHLTNNLANLHLHSEYQGTDQVHLTDGFDDQKSPLPRPE
ncbi:Retrovirus-related Pol polyprotein from transposon RE1 [Linum perenne]